MPSLSEGKATNLTRSLSALLWFASALCAQEPAQLSTPAPSPSTQAWDLSFILDGYFVPDSVDYGSPVFSADHNWLHLEARYNYENLATGSLWAGYNFSWGKSVQFAVTPMFGVVFGRLNGVAPGCEASLTYKKLEASISNEYVIAPSDSSKNFYYSWPQLTYSATDWLRVGAVAQHTKAYHTPLSIQRGFLIGFNYEKWETTVYVFNPGITTPTVVLELGVSF